MTFNVVPVGALSVHDATREEVSDALAYAASMAGSNARATTAYALHVGGIVAAKDHAFRSSFERGDYRYADGASVVFIARLGGARRIERAPTTDIGEDVLVKFRSLTGRVPRVAFIGGPPGLASRASRRLQDRGLIEPTGTWSGFGDEPRSALGGQQIKMSDIVIVGMGVPKETTWVNDHMDLLPHSLVLTCGGWFGFIAGQEERAPTWLQQLGLEWTYRLIQDPQRLIRRYALGVCATLRLATVACASRLKLRWTRT